MKTYDVTITETLQMTVPIKAGSRAEAEEKVEAGWIVILLFGGALSVMGGAIPALSARSVPRWKPMSRFCASMRTSTAYRNMWNC